VGERGPVVDFALKRPAVDPKRLVLIGWSFGGYLAPRAASGEHRIAALVADPGEWDQRDLWVAALPISDEEKKRYPDLSPETLRSLEESLQGPDANPFLSWALLQRGLWVNGVDTLHDYFVFTLDYKLSTVADRISCPTLLTLAEENFIAAFASKLYEALEVPEKRLVRFTAAEWAGAITPRPRGGPSTTSACSTGSTRCCRRHRGSTVRERTSSEVRQILPDLLLAFASLRTPVLGFLFT
jgi:pimeloyl-ACP methyl ester carboxylesterase